MLLSHNIRYLRKQKGLSQEELAHALGMKSLSSVQKWEDGTNVPPMRRIERIAEYFGRSVSEMLHINIERQDVAMRHPILLTPQEQQNIIKFRMLSPVSKQIIRAAIETAYELTMLEDAEKSGIKDSGDGADI